MTLHEEVFGAVSGYGFPVWSAPAPHNAHPPYVTFTRRDPGSQSYELSGSRGLLRQPIEFVAWSKDAEEAETAALELIPRLEAYTSSTVRAVRIRERTVGFNGPTRHHGFKVVAEFITTEE